MLKWRKFMKEGRALAARGLNLDAEQAFLKAACEVENSAEHEDLFAETLHELGVLMTIVGSFEEAETFLLKSLKLKEGKFGKVHSDVAATVTALGKVYAPFENVEAELQLRRAIAIYEELDDVNVVSPVECLSLILLLRGKRQERLQLLEELNNRMESKSGEHAALAGKSLFMLAQFWQEENERKSEELLVRALPLVCADDGQAQSAAEAALLLAKIQYRKQRFAEAEVNFKLALERADTLKQTSAHTTVEILSRLARLYMVVYRKFRPAEQLLMRAAAICQSHVPPLPTNNVLLEYDRLCEITGNYKNLERLRVELLEAFKSIIDEARDRCETAERSTYASTEACNLARLKRRQGRFDEAESYAKWAVATDEAGNSPRLVASLIELASVRLAAGKTEDASILCDRILQLKIDRDWYFPQLVDALRLFILLEREDDAHELEKIANEFIERFSGNHEWCTGLCHRLSLVYLEAGRKREARPFIDRALQEAEKMESKSSLFFAFMMESWAAQFRLAGSPQLSAEYEKRAVEIRKSVEASSNLLV